MSADSPRFGRGQPRPEVRARVAVMAGLLLVATALLVLRSWWSPPPGASTEVIVEVVGQVSAPGLHAFAPPATVHKALVAAGANPSGQVDAVLDAGTRIVVDGQGYRLERMDDLLVIGLPIDVNVAGPVALEAVPGIGPERAADIIADRDANGRFASVDDLARVRGIGPKTVEKLKPFLVAGGAR